MFEGQSQINKKRSEYSQSTFSVHKVAEETINAKLAQEQLNEMAQLIDLRFGHGTWQGIITERAKRIQEAKEHQARLQREARRKKRRAFKCFRYNSRYNSGGCWYYLWCLYIR